MRDIHTFTSPVENGVYVARVWADSEQEARARIVEDDPVWRRPTVQYHGGTDGEFTDDHWKWYGCRPSKRAFFEYHSLFAWMHKAA